MPSRSDGYLLDTLLAARSVQDFASGQTQESFAVDRLRIRAIEREFEILGTGIPSNGRTGQIGRDDLKNCKKQPTLRSPLFDEGPL